MFEDLWTSLVTQWTAFWRAFEAAGALANAIQIFAGAFAAVTSVHWYVRRKLKDKDGQILDLKEDLERRDRKLDDLRTQLKTSEERCAAIESRLPETAINKAEREKAEGNLNLANDTFRNWHASEGELISYMLLQRAQWSAAHAVAEVRALGLVTAEAYAIAAIVLWPENQGALDLLDDVVRLREEEGQSMPSLTAALGEFDDRAVILFDADLMEAANVAEEEASARYQRGLYHLALPVIEQALALRLRTVGRNAVQTFSTQHLKAYIVIGLGHSEEALPIARAVVAAKEASPALGPSHPETLSSRYLVAQILHSLGHSEEALPIARAVAAAKEASPALGPSHPQTLVSRSLVAQILHSLGHSEEALPIARAVAAAEEASPALGPSHPQTLVSRSLVAHIAQNISRD